MAYLCLDPSQNRTGYVVSSLEFEVIDYGVIEIDGDDYTRLSHLKKALRSLIDENGIIDIFSEDPGFFASRGSNWANRVLIAITVLIRCLAQKYGMPNPGFVNPMTLKCWFTGNGKATKGEIGEKVIERSHIDCQGDSDINDALAIFILLKEYGPEGFRQYIKEVKARNAKKRKKVKK